MLKNYLTVALRNLRKSKVHSVINIVGLSMGMAVSVLIAVWIWDEVSFNKSIPHYERIAQVYEHAMSNDQKATGDWVPFPLSTELRTHYGSNFRYVVEATWVGGHLVKVGAKTISRSGGYMEGDAPEMLSLTMLSGTRDGIRDGNTVLVSASTATAIFGDKDPVGLVMNIDNAVDVKVTGVYADLPANCQFNDLGFIGSWMAYKTSEPGLKTMDEPWHINGWRLYCEIAPNTNMAAVSRNIRQAHYKNFGPDAMKVRPELFLQPMSRWYLYSEFKNGVNVGGRIQYVWLFGIIGVFVLLLACINFMNLSTARSERRAREVGIRKAIGSLRRQLIGQFFTESLLMAFLAFLLSLILVSVSLPVFSDLAGKQLVMPWRAPLFWMAALFFCLFTGFVAGSYPALYLSSFRPVEVLKGVFKAGRLAALPRQILVVIQFTVSVSLIIGTVVVFRQIQFARNRPTGYNGNGLVMVQLQSPAIHQHFDAVKRELNEAGVIDEMAEASGPVTGVWSTNAGFTWEGKDPNLSDEFPNTGVSADYGHTVGWQFVAGRDFRKDMLTDSTTFVLNESAARFMGMVDKTGKIDAVGKIVKWNNVPFTVVGVIRDMLMESPYEPVRPSLFTMYKDHGSFELMRLSRTMAPGTALETVRKVFAKYSPADPWGYQFVDETYAQKFDNERRTGRLAGIFAVLAIFISCLGLFGMASYVAEQRTKEIGVRKVLGAGVFSLCRMLSGEFVVLVGIALVIAIPVSWYGMNQWLAGYTYRSGLSLWIFVLTGVAAIVITLLTVSVQAVRAAMANPAGSLRSE
jgi:putative ABC transport system permease protein